VDAHFPENRSKSLNVSDHHFHPQWYASKDRGFPSPGGNGPGQGRTLLWPVPSRFFPDQKSQIKIQKSHFVRGEFNRKQNEVVTYGTLDMLFSKSAFPPKTPFSTNVYKGLTRFLNSRF